MYLASLRCRRIEVALISKRPVDLFNSGWLGNLEGLL